MSEPLREIDVEMDVFFPLPPFHVGVGGALVRSAVGGSRSSVEKSPSACLPACHPT